MYFPYLRGRQYELLALRELLEKDILSKKIVPIVEPVRFSSALVKTLGLYGQKSRGLSIITNPNVGKFQEEWQNDKNEKLRKDFTQTIAKNNTLLFAKILLPGVGVEDFIKKYQNRMVTVCYNSDGISVYENSFSNKDVKYNLILGDEGFKRKIKKNRVLLADRFNKLGRNNDYMFADDELFSEDHLYYPNSEYVGFSDYSIVGKDYSDSGFAPYAVAIHIVYFAKDNSLRIKHFVSDSNDDNSDVAGKFQEALEKLVKWNKIMKLNTFGIREFESLYQREAYPGLGVVKKLSIMHHLELISTYLDN